MVSFYFPARRALVYCALFIMCALLITSCKFPWQHSQTSAVASTLGPKPTAQQLISTAQKNFRTVTAFHVVMKVENLGTAPDGAIQIRSADGDVVMPDKVKASANVLLSGQVVGVELVSIGDTQYLTDPITGQWRVVKGVLNASTLTDPNTGIVSLASKLTSLSKPVDDVVNGIPCWRFTGQLDAQTLAFLTGGGMPAGTMLQTSVCVGKADGLPYQLTVTGEAAKGDTAQTARTFTISNYNETINITAPQI
jgi:LppX_LprAFG lipoprotein